MLGYPLRLICLSMPLLFFVGCGGGGGGSDDGGGGAASGTISLAWNAVSAPGGVDGYRLYYGTAPNDYTSSVDVGNTVMYTLGGLTLGQRYYIAAAAYNASNPGELSNEVNGVAK
jgi:hypothetical protein